MPVVTTYPCPACGAPADLQSGCSGCGRAPDPRAAEVIRLDGTIRELSEAVEAARLAYDRSVRELAAVRAYRGVLAAQVRADSSRAPAQSVAARPAPPPDTAPPSRPGEAGPETSTRTVQNVLFALGGILLCVAAIVFTAVAWATFGAGGRAAILVTVTGLALTAPLVGLRRGLVASAETFAALGLLLVVLDGYAAWYINLFGLATAATPTAYAAGVCALSAAASGLYGRLTGLAGPRYAAVVAAQPVLPLAALEVNDARAVHALAYTVLAAANLATVRRVTGPLRILLWAFYGASLLVAVAYALAAQAVATTPAGVAQAGLSLVAAAAAFVAGAAITGNRVLRESSGAMAALTLAEAGGVFVMRMWPTWRLVLIALTVAVVAALVRILAPAGWRVGGRIGAGIAGGVVACPVAAMTVWAAAVAVSAARPAWHADLAAPASPFDWQVPAAAALLAAAAFTLAPRALRALVAAVGAGLLALAVPSAVSHTWWLPSAVDLLVAAPLAVLAVRRVSARAAVGLAWVSAVLAGHALLAGLGRPSGTAWVLWSIVAVGAAMLMGHTENRRAGAGVGLAVAVMSAPAAVDATVVAVGADVNRWGWAPLAAAGLGLGAVATIRRYAASQLHAAAVGVSGAALVGASFATLRTGSPVALPATVALVLLGALALIVSTADRSALAVPAVAASAPGLAALLSIAPAVSALILLPYTWLGEVWSGAPVDAPGLTPHGGSPIDATVAITLAALTVAAALAGAARGVAAVDVPNGAMAGARRGAIVGVMAVAPVALLAGLAAADTPWPGVPLVMLACGAAAALATALARLRGPAAVVGTAHAMALTGAGLAALLATKPTTLAGLGTVVVVGGVVGASGRTVGWLVTVTAGCLLAIAATLAADLPLWSAAYAVLAVAAAALGLGQWLRRWSSRTVGAAAVEAAAHAAAGVAVLLTHPLAMPGHTAAVLTLWGIALAVCAAWSPVAPARRLRFAVAAAGCELVAWWFLLAASEVTVLEAYTLPPAVAAAGGGVLAMRRRPELRSWVAYGPALAAAFLPSLALALGAGGTPLRRLLVGAGAVAVVIAGAVRRRQAPVAVGGLVLIVLALRELAAWWDLLPRWVPLAVAGLTLVALAMTYERRRRDMARLRAGFTRMT
jgi:hypothetical protein